LFWIGIIKKLDCSKLRDLKKLMKERESEYFSTFDDKNSIRAAHINISDDTNNEYNTMIPNSTSGGDV